MITNSRQMSDRDLWRSLIPSDEVLPTANGTAISDADLAAWLEGRLSEGEAANVDRAMNADPELRNAALALSEILGQPLPAPSPRLIVRAQALVGFEAERRGSLGMRSLLRSLFSANFRDGLQRAAMASISVVLAIAGFMVGGGLGDSYAHEKHAQAKAVVSPDTVTELGDLFTDGH